VADVTSSPIGVSLSESLGRGIATTGLRSRSRARSSAGQSSGLIIRWSVVRVHPGPMEESGFGTTRAPVTGALCVRSLFPIRAGMFAPGS
jgi:hypothetical protein